VFINWATNLTNSVEHKPSCEANSHSASSPPFMEPEFSLPYPQEPATGPHRELILMLPSYVCLDIHHGLFPSCSATRIVFAFLSISHARYMHHSSHHLWFDHPNNCMFKELKF